MKHSLTLVVTVLTVAVFLAIAIGASVAASEQQWVPRPHVVSTAPARAHDAAPPRWHRPQTGARPCEAAV